MVENVENVGTAETPEPEMDEEALGGVQRFRQTLQSAREWVDSIPTPGVDEGDALGGMSALAVAKDVLGSALNLLETPYVGDVTVEDIARDTFHFGLATTGAAARAGAAGSAGAVSVFGARPGRGASKEIHEQFDRLLQRSQEAERQGFSQDDIWRMTGMDRDPQGMWRYEIADVDSSIEWGAIFRMVQQPDLEMTLPRVLQHPQMYQHFPDLQNVRVGLTREPEYAGFFDRVNQKVFLNADNIAGPVTRPGTARQVLLHEVQHALQHLQSRPGGTNWTHANEQLQTSLSSVNRIIKAQKARGQEMTHEQQEAWYRLERSLSQLDEVAERFGQEKAAYYMNPGEVEARLVEAGLHRPELSPHARARELGLEHTWDVSEITFPSAPEPQPQPRGRTFGRREQPPAPGQVVDRQAHPVD